MLVLDATTKTIKAKISAAASTTNPDVVVTWADTTSSGITEGGTDTALNGSTDVTICAAPAASTRRVIKTIIICNRDSSPVTLTVKYDNNGTQRYIAVVVLNPNDTWTTDGTFDTNGSLKSITTLGGSVVSTTPTGTINGSNAAFTLPSSPSSKSAILSFAINGQAIHPNDYTLSGTTITFGTAPAAGLSGKEFTIVYMTGTLTAYTFGGFATITASTTAATNVFLYRCDTTSGSITLSLPAAASVPGVSWFVKKLVAANSVTIDPNGAETIDGFATWVLSTQYNSVQFYCNGVSWDIIT